MADYPRLTDEEFNAKRREAQLQDMAARWQVLQASAAYRESNDRLAAQGFDRQRLEFQLPVLMCSGCGVSVYYGRGSLDEKVIKLGIHTICRECVAEMGRQLGP